jgi:hypothetical protein
MGCPKCGSHSFTGSCDSCDYKHPFKKLYIDIILEVRGKKSYFKIFPFTEEIWIDINALPSSVRYTALVMQVPLLQSVVGKIEKFKIEFVNIEWVINYLNSAKQFINILDARKKEITEKFDEYRKMGREEED